MKEDLKQLITIYKVFFIKDVDDYYQIFKIGYILTNITNFSARTSIVKNKFSLKSK